VLLALAAALLAPGDAPAQAPTLGANPDSTLAAKLQEIAGAPLLLEDAFKLAMERSTQVQEAAYSLVAAQQAVRREKGIYDPELFANVERVSEDLPSSSPFAGADVLKNDDSHFGGGARMQLRYGTELEASLNSVKRNTNSDFALLDPQFDTVGLLSVRQPLLAGFGPSARVGLTVAERGVEQAQARYNDAVFSVKAQVENLYWDLYATERFVAVLQIITEQAQALLREAELRQAAGLGSPNQVANAQSFLAQQQLDQLDGEELLGRLSDDLAALLGTRPADGQTRFHPADTPPREFPLVPVETLLEETKQSNYQLIAANARVAEYQALVNAAKWDALPDLDLFGTLGASGLSGTGQTVDFGGIIIADSTQGGFGDTWDQIWAGDFPTWSVGLEVSIPIGLREGRGERDRLEAEARRTEQEYESLLRSLDVQVRAAHRALVNGARRMQAALDGVSATEEQVRIGLIEYRNGRSTAFELVILGSDLAQAQRRYSVALVRTAKAAAELRRLTSGAYPPGSQQ
jgi:outer membrane protein TolC